jgi:hypothetical protein
VHARNGELRKISLLAALSLHNYCVVTLAVICFLALGFIVIYYETQALADSLCLIEPILSIVKHVSSDLLAAVLVSVLGLGAELSEKTRSFAGD